MNAISSDARLVMEAQAVRAFGYGLTSVLLGVTLDELGFSGLEVGLVLAAVVAGTAAASIAIARYGDRFGRRRAYIVLYVVLAVSGVVFAFATSPWVLAVVALAGALSTEVVESGPFTSLEQAMLAEELPAARLASGFGIYNAVATAGGAVGALAAGLPSLTHDWLDVPSQRWFLLLVVAAFAGALVAVRLTPRVETERRGSARAARLERSRPTVARLSGLFALDAFGGGFVVQSFIAFWFARRFDATPGQIGVVFFAMSLLQTASFVLAPLLARRFGLLTTMVATHLPSNLFLIALAFAPNFPIAVGLLLCRVTISQMDVPTRQAYVMRLVDPHERVPAAAYTNTARYVVRPAGPALAGAASSLALGAPFVIGGTVKSFYDVVLWRWFRHVPLPRCTNGGPMIVCWRTVAVPDEERARFLAWIDENRQLREAHGICAELVLEPASGGDPVVVTIWPSHEVFDAWIATPDRDRLTDSDVHCAVEYRPIARYDVVGGYLNPDALARSYPNPGGTP